jgi:hypothetical protein
MQLPLVLLIILAGLVYGQEYRARVQGVVTDPSHAAIVGAKVTLKNLNTGLEEVKQTDTMGRYLFDFVQPGSYSVAVEAAGFQRFLQENVAVLTRGDVTVNAQMTVGGLAETVTVSAEVATVQFNTSTMTTTVQGTMLSEVPILARNPFTLALLNPAVINQYSDIEHRNPFYMWGSNGLDIGGRTGGKNDMLLDGVSLGVSARGSYMPSMDGVQEVAVQQNALDSEFGFSAGGILNVSMKSGTNDYHGTGYYFGRNPRLNAMTNRVSRGKSVIKNHIWGGTVGGPIFKNKVFFYALYEQWKNTEPRGQTYTAPTDLERAGDFSKSVQKNGALRIIYDPYTSVFDAASGTGNRQPFAGNIVPAARINATGQKLVNNLYKATGPGDDLSGINNVKVTYPWWLKYWNFSNRGDWYISEKWRMYARFSKYQTRLDNPNWGNSISVRSDNGGVMDALQPAIDFLWMATPRTTIDMRYGAVYVEDDYESDWSKVPESVWAGIWPNGWYKPLLASLPGIYYPNISWSGNGSASAGLSGWWLVRGRSHNSNLNVTHDAGIHHMKAGWQLRYQYDQNGNPAPGTMTFSYGDTCGPNFMLCAAATSGNMYASSLLGVLNSGSANFRPMRDSHQQLWGFFFQDDVKLTRNLTLNLGLRYELETAPSDYNRIYSRTLDLTQPIPEIVANPPKMPTEVTSIYKGNYIWNGAWIYTDDSHPGVFNSQKNVFLPRVGVAYRLNDKTALRLGFARYSVLWITIYPETNTWPTDGFSRSTSALGPLTGMPRTTIDNPFPSDNPLLLPVGKSLGRYLNLGGAVSFFPQDMIHPINDRINLSFQRQLPFRVMSDVTYFANLGHNVQDSSMWGGDYSYNINSSDPNYSYTYKGATSVSIANPFYNLYPEKIMPGALRTTRNVTVGSLLRPYPQYGSTITQRFLTGKESHYHSLQVKVDKSMSKGLSFSFGYNYSHETRDEFYDSIATYAKNFTLIDTRAPRHYIRLAGAYELPFGRGRQFLSTVNRAVDAVIGGWTTSHIYMWNQGSLLTFGDMVVTGNPKLANPTREKWFDTSMFSQTPNYTPRTNPWYYDGLRGPGFWSWDGTLAKYFRVTERVKFELRMEFYNVSNSFMPSSPNVSVTSSLFGKSTGVATGNYGREIQYTGRIHF